MRPKADPDRLPPMDSNHHTHYDKVSGEPLFDTGLHLLNLEEAKAKFAFTEAQIFKYDADLKNELLSKAPNIGLSFRELEIKRRLNFLRPIATRLEEFIKSHDTGGTNRRTLAAARPGKAPITLHKPPVGG